MFDTESYCLRNPGGESGCLSYRLRHSCGTTIVPVRISRSSTSTVVLGATQFWALDNLCASHVHASRHLQRLHYWTDNSELEVLAITRYSSEVVLRLLKPRTIWLSGSAYNCRPQRCGATGSVAAGDSDQEETVAARASLTAWPGQADKNSVFNSMPGCILRSTQHRRDSAVCARRPSLPQSLCF